ncbi:hypothetical protein [Butyrivibrio sp. AE2032]|uniref:hypothetical protein n=1 Tax=Butyrivibrio sp. AE2032 TaxID=1458463 RepID=UPI000A870F8C|nr:hypothetical protein [Butyrivibrio sp. AE2032]
MSNYEDLREREHEYIRIGDILERFKRIDEEYKHEPWTLEQIFSNLNMLSSKE